MPRAAKDYFILLQKFRCSLEENLERQFIIRSRAFTTFSAIENLLQSAGRMLCRPDGEFTSLCTKHLYADFDLKIKNSRSIDYKLRSRSEVCQTWRLWGLRPFCQAMYVFAQHKVFPQLPVI